MRRQVTLEQFPDIIESLPGKFEAATLRGLRSAAHRLEGYTVEEILAADAVASGDLSRSVSTDSLPDGARVTVDAPYAGAVEWGTRPHWPPIQPLIDWILLKGFAKAPSEARGMAYAVARAISLRGTAPRHYMRKAWTRIKPEIIRHVLREWNKIPP